jgi:hypothetical protein
MKDRHDNFWGTLIFIAIFALVLLLTYSHANPSTGDQCQAAPQQDYSNAQGC